MLTPEKHILLENYKLIIRLMNKYDGTQCYDTQIKLYKDVLNPERHAMMKEMQSKGITQYTCEHGNTFELFQICNCEYKNKQS